MLGSNAAGMHVSKVERILVVGGGKVGVMCRSDGGGGNSCTRVWGTWGIS